MPNVNLSTLSGPELRRLLDSARQRGEAALSYRILQEMEARREGGERRGLFPTRRSAEPRTVAVNLGDPMERDDDDLPPMPFWRAPSQVAQASIAPEPEPSAAEPITAIGDEPTPSSLELEPPLRFRSADPEPPGNAAEGGEDWDLRLPPPRVETIGPPRGLRRGLAVGFAVGIAAGVALGWWGGRIAHEPPPAATAAAPIQTASLERLPAPITAPTPPTAPEPSPALETPSEPTLALPPPNAHEVSLAPPDAPADADAEATAPPSPTAHESAEAVRTAETPRDNPCAAQPTPADRTICADPELRGLQRDLRQAYNEALEAHQDRALLRQRQLAWASARDTVTAPDRLAQLYEQRIRKLNAATVAARQQR